MRGFIRVLFCLFMYLWFRYNCSKYILFFGVSEVYCFLRNYIFYFLVFIKIFIVLKLMFNNF